MRKNIDNNAVFFLDQPIDIRFNKNAAGRVVSMTLVQIGLTAPRIK